MLVDTTDVSTVSVVSARPVELRASCFPVDAGSGAGFFAFAGAGAVRPAARCARGDRVGIPYCAMAGIEGSVLFRDLLRGARPTAQGYGQNIVVV